MFPIKNKDIEQFYRETLHLTKKDGKRFDWECLINDTQVISIEGLLDTEDWYSSLSERIFFFASGVTEGFMCDEEGNRIWEKIFFPGEILFQNRFDYPTKPIWLDFKSRSTIVSVGYKAFLRVAKDNGYDKLDYTFDEANVHE